MQCSDLVHDLLPAGYRRSFLLIFCIAMGRQKGDPNRSKTRPSSSSLAASLLQTSSTGSVGFGGYVGNTQLVPTPVLEKESLGNIGGEAAVHLRRLSKKDPTTKLKALEGLGALFIECPADELSQLLPHWVFEYKCLVQDNNRQVREATHDVMAKLALAAGRGLAPHLRTFMGAWWVSQFDPSSDVSEAAKRSFQVAFAVLTKRVEALRFTVNDILTYLDDSLKLTPQSISDKSTPVDESLKKHELVISSSLLSFAALLDILLVVPPSTMASMSASSASEDKISEKSSTLMRDRAAKFSLNHKFFSEFIRSKNPQIRCAAYQAVRALVQNVPEAFAFEDLGAVAVTVLGALGEKDPACHSPMWDMVLLFAQRFPQAWDFVQVKKVILPRLWGLLRHGCYGSPQVSYPCVLPLMSIIPVHVLKPALGFLLDFFCNLWQGHVVCLLAVKDRGALLKAFQECFLWIISNASRYSVEEGVTPDQIHQLLLEKVLVKLLWRSYVLAGQSLQNFSVLNASLSHEKGTNRKSEESSLAHEQLQKGIERNEGLRKERLPDQFIEELGLCVIELLDAVASKDLDLLLWFWNPFQDDCITVVINAAGSREQLSSEDNGNVNRISHFFSLLNERFLCKDKRKQWLMGQVVKPFVTKLFPAIKLLNYSPGIDLLATVVSICGPTSFSSLDVPDLAESASYNVEMKLDYTYFQESMEGSYDRVRKVFRDKVVPWCLNTKGNSSLSRINLLLSFFEDENFRSEWGHALVYATMFEVDETGVIILETDRVAILATLIEIFRCKFFQLVSMEDQVNNSSVLQQWNMSSLDGVALAVANSETLHHPAFLQLLRNLLGGAERDSPPLLSMEITERVFTSLLKRMLFALTGSAVQWADYAVSLILHSHKNDPSSACEKGICWELAWAALQAIRNSHFCLVFLDSKNGCGIVAEVMAAIIFVDWLYSKPHIKIANANKDAIDLEDAKSEDGDDIHDYESAEVSAKGSEDDGSDHDISSDTLNDIEGGKLLFMEVLKSICGKINGHFYKNLSKHSRMQLHRTLIHCVRFIVLEKAANPIDNAVVCAKRVIDLLKHTCYDKEETERLLDLLLEQDMHWPFWTNLSLMDNGIPVITHQQRPSQIQEQKHARFVAFIDKIILALGWNMLLFDLVSPLSKDTGKEKQYEGWQALAAGCSTSYRVCVLVELLCTWRWPGGNALHSVLPFLQSCAQQDVETPARHLVDAILHSLFVAASTRNGTVTGKCLTFWMCLDQDLEGINEPCLRALLLLLKNLLGTGAPWGKRDALRLLKKLVLEKTITGKGNMEITSCVITVLAPILRKQEEMFATNVSNNPLVTDGQLVFEEAVCKWLHLALSSPPLSTFQSGSDLENWVQMAVSCFPFHPAGGATTIAKAASANVSVQEKQLLLALCRKQTSREGVAGYHAHAAEYRVLPENDPKISILNRTTDLTLAMLVAAGTAYCWEDFGVEDWRFVISLLRKWLEAAVIDAEELAELVVDAVKEVVDDVTVKNVLADRTIAKLAQVLSGPRNSKRELTQTAMDIFSLIQCLDNGNATESSFFRIHLHESNWKRAELRAIEDILRLFFSTGLVESIAMDSIAGENAGNLISLSRKSSTHFWESIAEIAADASDQAKRAAAYSIDMWGIGNGAIRSLYALLLTPHPISALQWAAYRFLSTSPLQEFAVTHEQVFLHQEGQVEQFEEAIETSAEEPSSSQRVKLRSELSSILETLPSKLFDSQLTSPIRVCYLLGWAIFLTRLNSLSGYLTAAERLVQYAQDSNTPSTLLDCLFQYIPLKSALETSGARIKGLAVQANTDTVAAAANRAAASGSVSFAVEGLWPVGKESMSILAGALYGLILRVLPACARIWFTGLRDRSAASAIETFTVANCSPQLLVEEFSQVQSSALADDSLTVKANRTTREVTAIYKKEEAGMDMIIKLPACYPLRAVDVDCTKRLGISENRLRKWILSMAAFLRNQNGAVARAIEIWKQNVDREFDGVEECPICYSIIHTINHSLPRLACKTCKHKFHGACLYKWFSTSHKSTCPLCQTPF